MPWISLIGFMCSGKSSTGKLIARQLGWPHYDTDAMIVERTGLTVEELFLRDGEPHFRSLEYDMVDSLPPERDLVLSTGGGLVLSETAMKILHVQGPIFWLKVERSEVVDRCRRPWAARRPLLEEGENLEERVAHLMQQREPLYARWGTAIPGGFAHPREAGKHILDLLSRRQDFRPYFGADLAT